MTDTSEPTSPYPSPYLFAIIPKDVRVHEFRADIGTLAEMDLLQRANEPLGRVRSDVVRLTLTSKNLEDWLAAVDADPNLPRYNWNVSEDRPNVAIVSMAWPGEEAFNNQRQRIRAALQRGVHANFMTYRELRIDAGGGRLLFYRFTFKL